MERKTMKTTRIKPTWILSTCFLISVATFGLLLLVANRVLAVSPDADPPTLTAVSPSEAYNWKPVTVTITGTNFLAITAGKAVVGNPGSSDPEERTKCMEYMTKAIDFAKATGCKHALILGGIVAEGLSREESWANSIAFLKECAAYAEDKGVYLALESLQDEDVPINLVRTIDDMVRMIEEVDSSFILQIFVKNTGLMLLI